MKRSTLLSRFLATWEPTDLSGGLPGPPPPTSDAPTIEPPSLCEAGPCRRYHRLVAVLDAQPALDGSPTRARSITRACYPAPGIEVELGESPILQCSHWDPRPRSYRDEGRADYLASPEGRSLAEAASRYEDALGLTDSQED